MVIEVHDQSFEKEVLNWQKPAVVDFWAPWCGPCRIIAPVTERLSEEYVDRVKFCKLDVDKNPEMAQKYNVMSIPLLLFFKNGKKVDSILGAVPESMIKSKVEELL